MIVRWYIIYTDISFRNHLRDYTTLKERYTLPETNIAPENGWLEDYFPFGMTYFQGRTVSFREGISADVVFLSLKKTHFSLHDQTQGPRSTVG